jgi:heme exporter protein D
MIWQNWQEFFEMGGYGLYVWGSTIVTVAAMVGEVIAVKKRQSTAKAMLRRWVNVNRRNA